MKKKISLKLNGEVELAEFAKAMGHFTALIEKLTSDIGEQAEIDWEIAELEGGSALAAIIGKSANEIAVDKVVQAYEVIGRAITDRDPIPYSEAIAHEARSITQIINGKIKSVEMCTEEFKTIIDSSVIEQMPKEEEEGYSFGTVTGQVQTISDRGNMRFIVYDALFDRAVSCYLAKDQENLMLDAWDKRTISVAGKVYRDRETGRPYKVCDVYYIEKRKISPSGSFMRAQGIVPWKEGDELPEDIIRRYRDAQ